MSSHEFIEGTLNHFLKLLAQNKQMYDRNKIYVHESKP